MTTVIWVIVFLSLPFILRSFDKKLHPEVYVTYQVSPNDGKGLRFFVFLLVLVGGFFFWPLLILAFFLLLGL